jgi:putative transposase
VNRSKPTDRRVSMDDVESLAHTLWECKYHVAWIPKYRKKVMFCKLREQMGPLLKDLAMQAGCKILEGHLRPETVGKDET